MKQHNVQCCVVMDSPTREFVGIGYRIKRKIYINLDISFLLDLFILFQVSLFIYDPATGYFPCRLGKLRQTIEFVPFFFLILNFAAKYFLSILSEIVNLPQIRRLTTGLLTKEHQDISF